MIEHTALGLYEVQAAMKPVEISRESRCKIIPFPGGCQTAQVQAQTLISPESHTKKQGSVARLRGVDELMNRLHNRRNRSRTRLVVLS